MDLSAVFLSIVGKRVKKHLIQVEQPRDLARDSGQRKLTYSEYSRAVTP